LKIAIIAPYVSRPTPCEGWGPHLTIVHELSEGLKARGHEVLLYATGDSQFTGELRWLYEKAGTGPEISPARHNAWALGDALDASVDLIHTHEPLPFLQMGLGVPQVQTHHHIDLGPYRQRWQHLRAGLDPERSIYDVSISEAHRLVCAEGLTYSVIHHGIAPPPLLPEPTERSYLATFCRISRTKGIHLAIHAAKQAGILLKIAGVFADPEAQPYFDAEIRPHLAPGVVEFVGSLEGQVAKTAFLSGARAILNPILWEEPFGLSLLESMMCGTPVISFRRGAAPELIRHGRAGFLVENVRQMADAAREVDLLPREGVRQWATETFSADRMVANYEALFLRIRAEWSQRASQDQRAEHAVKRALLDQLASSETASRRGKQDASFFDCLRAQDPQKLIIAPTKPWYLRYQLSSAYGRSLTFVKHDLPRGARYLYGLPARTLGRGRRGAARGAD